MILSMQMCFLTIQSKLHHKQQQQLFLFLLLSYVKFLAKILEIKLEYWLPGITIGASGARQPVDISIK